MEQSELLRLVAEAFNRTSIPYFVTGSVATVYFGEPRFTNDIDVVAALPISKADALVREFREPEFYVSIEAVRQAIQANSQFNIIHPASGLKVDVIVPASTEFDRSRFARRLKVSHDRGGEIYVSSPEDVIIKKAMFYREGASEKHIRDIAGVFKVSGDRIDRGYIENWAKKLGIGDTWAEIAARIDKPQ